MTTSTYKPNPQSWSVLPWRHDDAARMADRDVSRIAAHAAGIVASMFRRNAGRKMTAEERQDLTADLLCSMYERSAAVDPRLTDGAGPVRHGKPADVLAYIDRFVGIRSGRVLWRAVDTEHASEIGRPVIPAVCERLSIRWVSVLSDDGRRWVRRHVAAAACLTDSEATERAYLEAVADDVAAVDLDAAELTDLLSLSPAERTAVEVALLTDSTGRHGGHRRGTSRPARTVIDLAAARGVKPNTLSVQARRGDKSLARRYPAPQAVRDAVAEAAPILPADARLSAHLRAERVLREQTDSVVRNHGVRLAWPEVRTVPAEPITVTGRRHDAVLAYIDRLLAQAERTIRPPMALNGPAGQAFPPGRSAAITGHHRMLDASGAWTEQHSYKSTPDPRTLPATGLQTHQCPRGWRAPNPPAARRTIRVLLTGTVNGQPIIRTC